MQHAEGVLGAPIRVWAIAESISDERVRVDLVGQDTQIYTDWNGSAKVVHGCDIKEIVSNYHKFYPEQRLRVITLFAGVGERVVTGAVNCSPLNPELLSTVTRKLIRELYGA